MKSEKNVNMKGNQGKLIREENVEWKRKKIDENIKVKGEKEDEAK